MSREIALFLTIKPSTTNEEITLSVNPTWTTIWFPKPKIVPSNSITLSSNSSKTVNNMSNVNKKYLPKIKVVGSGNITISNITNGDILTLNGLSNDEQIIIDCAIGSVINSNNQNRFVLLKDYNFIGLNKGKNTIQLTGNATIEFICEYPIIM